MFRDHEHFMEELAKSLEKDMEMLEKAAKPMFSHESKIRIAGAKTGHGYEVHETLKDGTVINHGSKGYQALDKKMHQTKDGKSVGLLRMKDSVQKGMPLHHEATVHHAAQTDGSKRYTVEYLHPAGDPHGFGSGKKDE